MPEAASSNGGRKLLQANRVLTLLWLVTALAFNATAQQHPQKSASDLPCDAFERDSEGEWIAKRDIMVPGAAGMVQIKAGMPVDDDLQERLNAQCK
jgi:hypothetical protein